MTKPRLFVSLVFALFAPAVISNCSSNAIPSSAAIQSSADRPVYAAEPVSGSTGPLASAGMASPDYKIAPRDILEVSVFQVQDLNKTIQVSDDGNISLPLIGKTAVGGKSTHEAEEIIGNKLRKKYLQSPQVSVFVKQYGQRVTVSGAVNLPKVVTLEGSLTLSQAVANAGGLNDLAEPKRVHVARSSGGHVHDEVFNYEDIQAGRAIDPPLQGGDLVVAEQSGARVVFKNLKDLLPFAILASVM